MDIFEYLNTLSKEKQVKFVNRIIDEYSKYLNCGSDNGTIITHHESYYRSSAEKKPISTVVILISDIADLKSIESCDNKIDDYNKYFEEIFDEIDEKFLPDEK